MKRFLFALIFCCSAVVFRAEATSYDKVYKMCMEEKKPVQLNLKTSFGTLEYDKSKNSQYIERIAFQNKYDHKVQNNKYRMLGLADFSITTVANMTVESWTTPQGYQCVIPIAVNLFVGYSNPTIYIAQEAQHSRCRELLTMRHEQTHMQINILALEYFLPQIKELAWQQAQLIDPVLVDKRNQNIKQEVDKAIEPFNLRIQNLVDQFTRYLKEEQYKLDNENNYNFESAICN